MRGKLIWIAALIFCAAVLAACTKVIRTPSDELCLYRWRGELENGNTAELYFDGDYAGLDLKGEGLSLELYGVYAVTDDCLIICDRATGAHFNFGYRLYGDRIELSCDDGAVSLDKVKKENEG